jgi:hypothetical protein
MVRSPKFQGTASSVGQVISDTGDTLSAVLRHARSLAEMESLLAEYSGSQTAAQFQVAAMREDRLVLLTPTAAWATRLRMQAEQMLRFLQASGYGQLRRIDVRVAPLHHPPVEKKVRRHLSPAAELAFELMHRMSKNSND